MDFNPFLTPIGFSTYFYNSKFSCMANKLIHVVENVLNQNIVNLKLIMIDELIQTSTIVLNL